MKAFNGQIAVVTGGGSGIGRAIALGLAEQGATLCLVGRQLEKLQAVAENAQSTGVKTVCYRADLTVDEEVQELAARLGKDFDQIDILVHSAGVISQGPIEHAPVADLDWQYRTNVRAPYVLTQALLPMLKSRQGQIVFINSTAGLTTRANVGQYAATKHALKAIADSLRWEVNTYGIRVLSIYLGRTASPMQAAIYEMEGREYHPELLMQPEDAAVAVVSALGMPRSAEVTDINIRPLLKSY